MLDLFSGIGGFALSASWVWKDDLDIVGFCEIDKYCQKVLKKNFPGVPIYKDITKLDTKNFKDIDLITGGFPCQDISIAGKGKGLIDEETGEQTRSGLWSEMYRIISDIRPRYAVIENVPMLTLRGGTRVIEDLAEIGYDSEWQIVGANEVGAWHRRKRIWIVSYPGCEYGEREKKLSKYEIKDRSKNATQSKRSIKCNRKRTPRRTENVTEKKIFNSCRYRRIQKQFHFKTERKEEESFFRKHYRTSRTRRITKKPKSYWNAEPKLGRVANGIPNRVDRLKGLGNAIVPQVAYEIFKRIAY